MNASIQRFSPYAVDGGADAYGQMEEDDHGDYVNFEDHQASVAAALEAAAELLGSEADNLEASASRFRGGTNPHHSRMDQLLDLSSSQPFNIQPALTGEMHQPLQELCRATGIHAAGDRLAGWPLQRMTAFGAVVGKRNSALATIPAGFNHFDYFRNDIPGPLNQHRIANADIFSFNLILIV